MYYLNEERDRKDKDILFQNFRIKYGIKINEFFNLLTSSQRIIVTDNKRNVPNKT